ncbi:MAG: uracil-DNA glycosylase [Corynebacterium sp.]|nr:uracil-DNA glycosylase [Corynebacterium sp.]
MTTPTTWYSTMHPDWLPALQGQPDIAAKLEDIAAALTHETELCPPLDKTFAALEYAPAATKVVIVGQDPYPTPGHAMGLSFSVSPDINPIPRSLKNIFTEYEEDLGLAAPLNGDLRPWANNGVLLLNRMLSTTAHNAGAHARLGWQDITDAIIAHQIRSEARIVFILWGKHAQEIISRAPIAAAIEESKSTGGPRFITSAHPSPLSARRGFFGSKPFSTANSLLAEMGREPVDWTLPSGGLF